MDGSSSTYKTPVVRFRTALASCIRCRSPVESVEAARSRERYESPKSISLFADDKKDSQMLSAMGRIFSGKDSGTPAVHKTNSPNGIRQA